MRIKVQNNSYSKFEEEHSELKSIYMDKLRDVCEKKAEDSLTMLDVSDYMSVSSKYFGLPEKYSHDILAEKRYLRGFKISSFADDCFSILETYVFHTILLKDLLLKYSGMELKDVLSTKTLTNTQRVVVKYSSHGSDSLKEKFIKNELSTHGFDVKNAKDELDLPLKDIVLIIVGIVGFIIVSILAFVFPTPTAWQQFIQRTIVSLSSAILIATLPGFVSLDIRAKLEENRVKIIAGGSFAIFLIIYFFNPAFMPA